MNWRFLRSAFHMSMYERSCQKCIHPICPGESYIKKVWVLNPPEGRSRVVETYEHCQCPDPEGDWEKYHDADDNFESEEFEHKIAA